MKTETLTLWHIEADTLGVYWGGAHHGWCTGRPITWWISDEAEAARQLAVAKNEHKQIKPRLIVSTYTIQQIQINQVQG